MIADFLTMLVGGIFDFLNGFFHVFPSMPVDDISDMLGVNIVVTVLGWVNYFLPLDVAASIVAIWSTAIMAYIGLKLAMRYTGELI